VDDFFKIVAAGSAFFGSAWQLMIFGSQRWATGGPVCRVHSLTIWFATAMKPAAAATPMMTSAVRMAMATPATTPSRSGR
jgi:hypothetical protein